ncbi:DUF1491 family protein [Altererythrobacter sp. GH1-8]|uniref:DUF1491 family protein n=1 Tax=Altererythrobacter sp. GH1-8 TaxID=3349333 RepID=UPI00374D6216
MDERLPAHLEVAAIIRLAQSEGGFATVLARGERDAGTILLLTTYRGNSVTLFERMPQLDGTRSFTPTKQENPENKQEFADYLDRRKRQDPDIWVVEVDVANAQHFVELLPC